MSKQDLILEVVTNNLGEKKHIDEWMGLINEHMPKPKKINRRSVQHLIRTIGTKGYIINREMINKNVFYEFDKELN